jgi:methylenetetrahydrofolate reductase (NADPH)
MVTVRDQLAAPGFHFSVEFYPPRSDDEESLLWTTIRSLEARRPAFVSVTYGAGGSHRDRTIRVTEQIAAQTTLLPVAHLTAVGHTVAELRRIIGAYASAGVHNILALRGDPPGSDPHAPWIPTPGGLAHADELVTLTRSLGEFSVGVAAYPTKHPQSPDIATDTRHLAGKVAAGADFVVTQMLFSAADYAALVQRARAAGVDVPIIPGVMPVTSSTRLARICQLSGQPVPTELAGRLAAAADPAAARAIGVQHALTMCRDLMDMGAPSLHFYTFTRSTLTLTLLDELGIGAAGDVPAGGGALAQR